MATNKVVYNGNTLIDLSGDTVSSADDIVSGKVGHLRDGTQVTGTASGGTTTQGIYTGTSTPASSTGSDGDVFILASSGGSAELYPANFTSSGMNSTSNASKCIGVSAEDGSATGNCYSSGSGTTGVIEYTFDLPSIPGTATIESVACQVMAHEENSSRSTFTLQLYSGSTAKGSATTVNGTSNTIYTLSCGTWTASEIADLVLHTEYGYYGGLVAGATLTISYTVNDATYEVTLTGSENSWTISGSGIYKKESGSWTQTNSVSLDAVIERK